MTKPLRSLLDHSRRGIPRPSPMNAAIAAAALLGDAVRTDPQAGRVVITKSIESLGIRAPGPWSDDNTRAFLEACDAHGLHISRANALRAIRGRAKRNALERLTVPPRADVARLASSS